MSLYMKNLAFYINGNWCAPLTSTQRLPVINPATQATFAQVCLANTDDAQAAINAAANAFEDWSQTSLQQRIVMVEAFLVAYQAHYEDMAKAITEEMGAPASMSYDMQAEAGVGHTEAHLQHAKAVLLEEPIGDYGQLLKEPIGVCVLITPWNWPINQIVCKVIPALLAGCTMVLKPSELTPMSAQLFTQCIHQAGIPAGVFNMIHGTGADIGSYITSHPLVDMVSFTGSTRAGVEIAKSAAATVKRVSQELGGKSANIIFADADLGAQVRLGVQACMLNSGQSCDAPTRMLVEASVYNQVVDMALAAVEALNLGDPQQQGDHLGPVISQDHWHKVQGLIQAGIDEGATLLAGGVGKPQRYEQGYYVKPTLFGDVNNAMTIAQEEVFGPVLVLIPFANEAEAIRIANDSPYGLGAYVSTQDMAKAQRVARKLRAGTVHINMADLEYCMPFGGYKQSGNGREYAGFGLHEFQEIKAIAGYR
jgi:aldehyde dehydrogenase (NAD+)